MLRHDVSFRVSRGIQTQLSCLQLVEHLGADLTTQPPIVFRSLLELLIRCQSGRHQGILDEPGQAMCVLPLPVLLLVPLRVKGPQLRDGLCHASTDGCRPPAAHQASPDPLDANGGSRVQGELSRKPGPRLPERPAGLPSDVAPVHALHEQRRLGLLLG
eukprot:scaffold428_cov176-Pinguiococcus_pyrenoidosus.AAC.1